MKKLFIAAMALATIVSCSKDDGVDEVLTSSKKSVSIKIENMVAGSRAVTESAVGATDLKCAQTNDLVFVFCDASWNKVVAKTTADAAEDTTDGSYIFHALPQTVANVFVIANGKTKYTAENAPASKTVAETAWKETETIDVEWKEIVVYGAADDFARVTDANGPVFCGTDTKYPLYSASVKVVPAHARIEIPSVSCVDLGINDYGYNKLTLNSLNLASEKYTQDINAQLTANPSVKSASATGGVWSWNVLEQDKSDLVLKITVNEGKNWTIPAGTENRTVTVVDYKAPTGYANTENVENGNLKKFVSGEIYTLSIPFYEANIDNDQDFICVDVAVEIANWVVVEVTPEFKN